MFATTPAISSPRSVHRTLLVAAYTPTATAIPKDVVAATHVKVRFIIDLHGQGCAAVGLPGRDQRLHWPL